jgi:predicted kinase
MSDTPIMDDVDEIVRHSRGDSKPDSLSDKERAALQRKGAEERLRNSSPSKVKQRQEFAKAFTESKRVLKAAVESVRHGQVLDGYERAELEEAIHKDLRDAPNAFVSQFVKAIAEPIANGNKGEAWAIAENAAETLAQKGWRPTEPEKPELTTEQILERIPRV